LELYTEHARGYLRSVNHQSDQERHHAKCIGQQAVSIGNLTEVPEQWGIQDKSSDEAWAIDTRECGCAWNKPFRTLSEKQRAKKRKTTARFGNIEASAQKAIAEHHPESVDSPPALTIVARQRVLACPVCEVRSFFEEVKRCCEWKQPNRLTEGQTSQQFN